MESLRRPSVLVALAAAVLTINLVVLATGDDTPDVAIDGDPVAGEAAGGDESAAGGDGDGAGDGEAAATDDSDGASTDTGGTGTDAGDGATDDSSGAAGEAAPEGDEPTTPPAGDGGGLGLPTGGTYTYASGGSWSLAITDQPTEENQLPATATAVVERDGGDWRLRLQAGAKYADEFGFQLGADGGLDWIDWVLERESPNLGAATSYTCSGDSAHYRPDETGRVASHVCETQGLVSTGSIEHTGTEEVTLGDGTVVSADRLLYTYTVEGDGVSGGGQLDLWLDPATGLRLREARTISTTSVAGAITYEYREDVEFTLQSLSAT